MINDWGDPDNDHDPATFSLLDEELLADDPGCDTCGLESHPTHATHEE